MVVVGAVRYRGSIMFERKLWTALRYDLLCCRWFLCADDRRHFYPTQETS